MLNDRTIHLVILGVSVLGLILLIVSMAGSNWAGISVYSTGIFIGCINVGVFLCTNEFVFPIACILKYKIDVFRYALDTTWFYVVRVMLLLSIPLILSGIICSFSRENLKMKIISGVSFIVAGIFKLIRGVYFD